jgi:hypothetical protein
MSISGRIIPAIAALLLAGFANSTASAQAVHPSASASVTDTMMVVRFDTMTVDNACPGASDQKILVVGTQRLRMNWLERQNGSMLLINISYNGVDGTGQTTGNSYVLTQGYKDLVHLGATTYATTVTFREQLIEQGSGSVTWLHLIENFSFDGTTLKATVQSLTARCTPAGH